MFGPYGPQGWIRPSPDPRSAHGPAPAQPPGSALDPLQVESLVLTHAGAGVAAEPSLVRRVPDADAEPRRARRTLRAARGEARARAAGPPRRGLLLHPVRLRCATAGRERDQSKPSPSPLKRRTSPRAKRGFLA